MDTNHKIPRFATELPDGYHWATNLDRDSDEVVSFIHGIWPKYLTEPSDIDISVPHEPENYHRYCAERYFLWGIREVASQQLIACLSCVSLHSESRQIE